MRIPPNYEVLIQDIAHIAGKHGYLFEHDTLTDHLLYGPNNAHRFEAHICLSRNAKDFMEDAVIPLQTENSGNRTDI